MSETTCTRGSFWNSSQLHRWGCSTSPSTRSSHVPRSARGTEPYCNTGHFSVFTCPGGSRGSRRGLSNLSAAPASMFISISEGPGEVPRSGRLRRGTRTWDRLMQGAMVPHQRAGVARAGGCVRERGGGPGAARPARGAAPAPAEVRNGEVPGGMLPAGDSPARLARRARTPAAARALARPGQKSVLRLAKNERPGSSSEPSARR